MITVLVLVTFYDENGLHKAGSITKVNENDFNPAYMKKLNPPSPGGSTELSELDDVDISGVSDGEVLTYDAATEKWVNATGGGGSGSVITNIFDDGEGHVESMDIDGTTYEFGTGETTIDLSSIQTDSNGKVNLMDIDGTNYEFTSVENVSTDDNSKVESMDIDGTNYEFGTGTASVSNISQNSKGKVESFDLTTPDGTDTLEFVNLLEDLEDVDISGIADGEVLTYQNGGWTYSAPTKIENISETGGVVDSMDIDGATYNFATGGGGGGGSSLVVNLAATTGTTVDLAMMSANSSVSVGADKTYAEMKAADEIIFKIVDTNQAGGQKWTLKPTGMHTLNVSADQALFFTFTVLAPGANSLKIFRLEVGPWGNYFTLTCMA